jgi:hypothetical protein
MGVTTPYEYEIISLYIYTVKHHRDEQRDVSRTVAFEVKPCRYIVWNEIAVIKYRHYLYLLIISKCPFSGA